MTTVTAVQPRQLEGHGLTKTYGRITAVDNLNLSVGGGLVGLLGPNGAGKTTLLRMLATVLAPDAGALGLLGLDPSSPQQRVQIRRNLGYLPQSPTLYPRFTALELVDYVAVLKQHTRRDQRQDEVVRVLTAVGLAGAMHRKIGRLSLGQQQRVALAAALLGDPALLVLDEPAAGLDPEQRIELRAMLAASAGRGTVVLSTHDTAEVAAICQRVLVMSAGRILFDGTPAALRMRADGMVWEDDVPDPTALRSWMTAEGRFRHLGQLPSGAAPSPATLDDGYLLVAGRHR
jgi:ABC-2 type transport system ATP-binding protein